MSNYPGPAAPKRPLTAEELNAYAEDGAVCARGLLDMATIAELRDALEDAIERLAVMGKNKNAISLENKGFHGDIFVWKLHDAFRDLALFSCFPTLAQQVLRTPTVRFFYMGWDMEPGDVLIFGPTVSHGSAGNASNTRDRRALAFRYCGGDVCYAPRHATPPCPCCGSTGCNPVAPWAAACSRRCGVGRFDALPARLLAA